MFTLITAEQLRSPRIRRFADYWNARKAGRAVPSRQDIEPADLKELLPYMMVVEIEAEPFRILYRLAGTRVVEMNGIELTGRYLDEFTHDEATYADQGIAAYREAWQRQCPVFGSYDWPTPSGEKYLVEFAIFPVTQEGTAGQCIAFEDWETAGEAAPLHEAPLPFIKDKGRRS